MLLKKWQTHQNKRLKLYKFVAALLRAYASIASELAEAGYKPDEIEKIKAEVVAEALAKKW